MCDMEKKVAREHLKERYATVNNYLESPPLPRSLSIELNNTCNQKCVFCPYHGDYAPTVPKPAVMSYDMAVKLLDEAMKLGIGKKEVGFYFAGEVFLHKDLHKIIRHAKEIGYEYTYITTNGSLANQEKIRNLLDAGCDSIRFSINAADKESYAEIHGRDDFDKVLQNIKFMHSYIKDNALKTSTSISCILTKKTEDAKEKIKNIFGDFVDDIIFMPVILNRLKCDQNFIDEYGLIDTSNTSVNYDFVCPIVFDSMYINANLEVVPCCDAYCENVVCFDLKQEFDLKKAWESEALKKYRNIFLKKQDGKGTICENCYLRMTGLKLSSE